MKKQLGDKMVLWRKENAALKVKNADLEKTCADHVVHLVAQLEEVKKVGKGGRTPQENRKDVTQKSRPG